MYCRRRIAEQADLVSMEKAQWNRAWSNWYSGSRRLWGMHLTSWILTICTSPNPGQLVRVIYQSTVAYPYHVTRRTLQSSDEAPCWRSQCGYILLGLYLILVLLSKLFFAIVVWGDLLNPATFEWKSGCGRGLWKLPFKLSILPPKAVAVTWILCLRLRWECEIFWSRIEFPRNGSMIVGHCMIWAQLHGWPTRTFMTSPPSAHHVLWSASVISSD